MTYYNPAQPYTHYWPASQSTTAIWMQCDNRMELDDVSMAGNLDAPQRLPVGGNASVGVPRGGYVAPAQTVVAELNKKTLEAATTARARVTKYTHQINRVNQALAQVTRTLTGGNVLNEDEFYTAARRGLKLEAELTRALAERAALMRKLGA